MVLFAENKELFLEKHSNDFHNSFMQMLGSRYKNGRHSAKAIYEDFISDPFHVHLNSTRWTSFTSYVKYLGKEGFAKVEETDGGWMIQYIDRTGNIDKQKSAQKKAIVEKTDEERERILLQEQLNAAKIPEEVNVNKTFAELKRDDGNPIKLAFKPVQAKIIKPKKLSSLLKK
ncbi:DNA/RNA-binding protein kin17 [Boothiomyces sp. JEL0866]|nr:DNA/RNA-binding protein kin17 [Boothiomyces sp. JEL0866]